MRRRPPAPPENSNQNTGSPQPGGPVFLAVGKLRRPHGIDGEFLMDILTDFPERLRKGRTVYVGEDRQPMKLEHVRRQDAAMLVTFEGLTHIDLVGFLRNQIVYIRAERLPKLPEGEYYHHELLGIRVVDESGKEVGFLSEILETGANDVYLLVAPDGTETLLPAIEAVILEVNLDRREMIVRLPEWL